MSERKIISLIRLIENKPYLFRFQIVFRVIVFATILICFNIGAGCTNPKVNRTDCDYFDLGVPCDFQLLKKSNKNSNPDGIDSILIIFEKGGRTQRGLIEISQHKRCISYLDLYGQKDGLYQCNLINGQMLVHGKWNNNLKDSTWSYFSKKGQISHIRNYFGGEPIGHDYKFDDKGIIEEYCLIGPNRQCYFNIKYDENGKIDLEKGTGEVLFLWNNEKKYSIGDTIRANIFCVTSFDFNLEVLEPVIFNDNQFDFYEIRSGIYYIEFHFEQPGEYTIPFGIFRSHAIDGESLYTEYLTVEIFSDEPIH